MSAALTSRLAELQSALAAAVGEELEASDRYTTERALAADPDLHWRERQSHMVLSVSYRMAWDRHQERANRLRLQIASVQRLIQEDADLRALSNEEFLRRLSLPAAAVEGMDDVMEFAGGRA